MKHTCTIDGCQRIAHARGWCKAHHMLWLRNGSPYIDARSKRLDAVTVYRLNMRLTIAEKEQLDALVFTLGLSMTDVVRRAIAQLHELEA